MMTMVMIVNNYDDNGGDCHYDNNYDDDGDDNDDDCHSANNYHDNCDDNDEKPSTRSLQLLIPVQRRADVRLSTKVPKVLVFKFVQQS